MMLDNDRQPVIVAEEEQYPFQATLLPSSATITLLDSSGDIVYEEVISLMSENLKS